MKRFDVISKSELENKLKYVCGTKNHKMFEDDKFNYFVTLIGEQYEIFYITEKKIIKK